MVLPQMGLEVSEGTVTALLVAVGDSVSEGDTVAEVETDKAIAEVAAPRSGFVTAIEVEVGDTVPVGAMLIRIGESRDEAADSSAGPAAEHVVADFSAGPVAAGDP
ncbi:MAG: hypothetical protein QOI84_590, partial [Solirubrobacterales bacterium]|nr:hypothetical protein [Solirubrobacterales bacterium]